MSPMNQKNSKATNAKQNSVIDLNARPMRLKPAKLPKNCLIVPMVVLPVPERIRHCR